jgi:hypothetical protein
MQRPLIDRLAREVISRLAKPRVAFLWSLGEVPDKPLEAEVFNAIYYLPAESCFAPLCHLRPCYFLDRIDDLKREVETLDLLVVLQVPPEVLQELCFAFSVSKLGLFISYFIDAGKPVIMDLSVIRERCRWSGPMQKLLESHLEELKGLGVAFIDKKAPDKALHTTKSESKRLVIKDKGWLTWGDVSGLISYGCEVLVLEGNTKLTLEALSRLRVRGIRVERGEG